MNRNNLPRKIFIASGILFLAFLIFLFVKDLPTILKAVRQAKWYWLLVAALFQVGTYFFLTLIFRDIFLFFGHRLKFSNLFKISFSLNYLNQMLPTLGVSGLYFLVLALKKREVPADKSIVAGILYYIFIYFTFIPLLLYALLQLLLSHQISRVGILATFGSIIFVLGIVLFSMFLLRKRERFKKALELFLWPLRKFFKGNTEKEKEFGEFLKPDFLADTLLGDMTEFNRKKTRILAPIFYSLLIHIFDVATLYFLFYAFNFHIGFSAAAIGFVSGMILGFISVIPTGIGIEEAGRGLILNLFGAPLGIAVLVSVIFRALSFWINIPLGAFIYKDLKKSLE